MKLTKILAMLLALCMILCCFAACGGASDDEDEDEDEKVEEKDEDKDEDEDKDKGDVDLDFDFGIGGKETSVETTAPVDQDPVDVPVEKDSIVGTWKGEINYANLIEGKMDMDINADLMFPISLEFKENGTLVQRVDMPSDRDIQKFVLPYAEAAFDYSMERANYDDAEEFAKANGYDSYEDCLDFLVEQCENELEGQKTAISSMNTTYRYTYSDGVIKITGFDMEIDLNGDRFEVKSATNADMDMIYRGIVFEKQ